VATSSSAWSHQRDFRPGLWYVAPFATDATKPFSLDFPHAGRAMLRMLPVLAPLFALALVWYRRTGTARRLRSCAFGFSHSGAHSRSTNGDRLRAGSGMDVNMDLDDARALVVEHRVGSPTMVAR
jgi:hypothetical protein